MKKLLLLAVCSLALPLYGASDSMGLAFLPILMGAPTQARQRFSAGASVSWYKTGDSPLITLTGQNKMFTTSQATAVPGFFFSASRELAQFFTLGGHHLTADAGIKFGYSAKNPAVRSDLADPDFGSPQCYGLSSVKEKRLTGFVEISRLSKSMRMGGYAGLALGFGTLNRLNLYDNGTNAYTGEAMIGENPTVMGEFGLTCVKSFHEKLYVHTEFAFSAGNVRFNRHVIVGDNPDANAPIQYTDLQLATNQYSLYLSTTFKMLTLCYRFAFAIGTEF